MTAQKATWRLPFWPTVIHAHAVTFNNLGYLARISWVWLLLTTPIYFAFTYLMLWLDWHRNDAPYSFGSLFSYFASIAIWLPLIASVAVAWHRKLLVNEEWQGRIYLRLDRVVARYIGLAAILALLVDVPFYPVLDSLPLIGEEGSYGGGTAWIVTCTLAVCAGVFVAFRVWLILPACALEREVAPGTAWLAAKGNFWRLFWGSLFCFLPTFVVFAALVLALEIPVIGNMSWISYAIYDTMLNLVVLFLCAVPSLTFLSLAYRWLIERRTDNLSV